MKTNPNCASRRRWLTLTCIALFLAHSAPAAIFVKIPNIAGGVITEGYNDGTWFQVESGSYGVERELPGSSEKGGVEDINIGIGRMLPIGLAGQLSQATPPLAQAAINGNSIGDVLIHLVDLKNANGTPELFASISLKRAFVRSFTFDTPNGGRPWFQCFLIYNEIEMSTVHPGTTPDKSTVFTSAWNLVTNTGKFTDGTSTNEEPSISAILPQSVAEDGTLTVAFTVADPDGPAAELAVAGSSSNQGLLPDANITISGEGAERVVSLSPAPNQNGVTKVTLTVTDSAASIGAAFELTVDPAPDPPAIQQIPDQVADEGTPLVIPIKANDPEQHPNTLALTATSSNQRLLLDRNIAFTYDESTGWTMSLAFIAGQSGSSEIKLIVADDAGAQASTTFVVSVNSAANSAPTDILLETATISEDAPLGTVVGTLSAVDPDRDTSIEFALPVDAEGRFVLSGGNTIVTNARLDFESGPSHEIRVRATDPSGASFAKVIRISVENVNEAPFIELDLPGTVSPSVKPGVSLTGIDMIDPDSGASEIRGTFRVVNGALTLDDTGVLFDKVTGNGTKSVTAEAALADLLQVLAGGGLRYAADNGFSGQENLAVTVNDLGNSGTGGALEISKTGTFVVEGQPFQFWLDRHFTVNERNDPNISGLAADADSDTLSTIVEFKLGTDPRDSSDSDARVELSEAEVDGKTYVELTFVQRTDASTPGTTLEVQTATALSAWLSGPEFIQIVNRQLLGDDLERLTLRPTASREEEPTQYFRFKVVRSAN